MITQYRIWITVIWWFFGVLILLGFAWISAQSGVFGALRSEAFDWLIPNLVPTMTLTGAVAYGAPKAPNLDAPIAQVRFLFLLACTLSIIYLFVLIAVIFGSLIAVTESPRGVLDALTSWNSLLGILQGFAASAIGIFFVRN